MPIIEKVSRLTRMSEIFLEQTKLSTSFLDNQRFDELQQEFDDLLMLNKLEDEVNLEETKF